MKSWFELEYKQINKMINANHYNDFIFINILLIKHQMIYLLL